MFINFQFYYYRRSLGNLGICIAINIKSLSGVTIIYSFFVFILRKDKSLIGSKSLTKLLAFAVSNDIYLA